MLISSKSSFCACSAEVQGSCGCVIQPTFGSLFPLGNAGCADVSGISWYPYGY